MVLTPRLKESLLSGAVLHSLQR